jgi:hypothetical protein
MEAPRLKIYQYDAKNQIVPTVASDDTNEDKTRWIAAVDDIAADAIAKQYGWTLCGGEIFKNHQYYTMHDYLEAGCDIVVFSPVYENHYACPDCCEEWNDVWDSGCNDDCPNCGSRDISPIESVQIS